MQQEYIDSNNRQRERLIALVNRLTDRELSLVLYQEGWTIASALAHIAFWDMRRIVLLKKWHKEGVAPSPSDDDVFNDTMLPFFLKLAPREAASLAVTNAITGPGTGTTARCDGNRHRSHGRPACLEPRAAPPDAPGRY